MSQKTLTPFRESILSRLPQFRTNLAERGQARQVNVMIGFGWIKESGHYSERYLEITQAGRDARAATWRTRNHEAIETQNAWLEKDGLPLSEWRTVP